MTTKKRSNMQNCRTCLIIRYFLISVLFLVMLGLIFTDKTHYLSFIKTDFVAYLIIPIGMMIFFSKLFQHFKKLSTSDQSDKIRNTSRRPSKSVPSKNIH